MKKNGINVTIVSIFDRRCKIMRYIAFLFIWILSCNLTVNAQEEIPADSGTEGTVPRHPTVT